MICFLDRTFCGSKTHKPDCNQQLTPELKERAREWWGSDDAPISYIDYCETGLANAPAKD